MLPINQTICGDALTVLRTFPDESIHCCVTSPPYWGLRDYGIDGQLGLEKTPEEYVAKMVEVFREVKRVLRKDGTLWLNLGDSHCQDSHVRTKGTEAFMNKGDTGYNACLAENRTNRKRRTFGQFAGTGLKPKDLVGIPWRVAFALQQPHYTGNIKREADRIWLASMIDGEGCMFIHKRKVGQSNGQGYERKHDSYGAGLEVANTHESIIEKCMAITGLGSICRVERETKHKQRNIPLYRWNLRSNQCREVIKEIYPYLVGKQHEARLVLGCPSSGSDAEKAHYSLMALHNGRQATIDFPAPASMFEQGFYLRSDIIWSKANPMPESVTDRPTKAHEYIFLLSKSQKYWYDQEAVKENGVTDEGSKAGHRFGGNKNNEKNSLTCHSNQPGKKWEFTPTRNLRTVWTIPTAPYKEAHFATFPPKLIEPCILAGCPENGIVLDPFMGSGTVAQVATLHRRNWIGIELNEKYIELSEQRRRVTPRMF